MFAPTRIALGVQDYGVLHTEYTHLVVFTLQCPSPVTLAVIE